jgi:hypothetical protein
MSLFGKAIDELIGAVSGKPPTETPLRDAVGRLARRWPQPWMVLMAWGNAVLFVGVGWWLRTHLLDDAAQFVGRVLPFIGLANAVGLTVIWWWRRDA